MEPKVLLGLAVGLLAVFLLSIKISREPFWGLAALIFFLPFERLPTLEIAGFTAKINHAVGGLLVIFWLLDLAFNRRRLRPNPTAVPVILLIVSLILSFLAPVVTTRSLVFFGLDLFVILLYLSTVQLVDSQEKLAKINQVLIWTSWLIVAFGLYQFFGDFAGLPTGLDPGYAKAIFGFPRIQAFSREPLYLGNYLLIPLCVGFAHYFSKVKSSKLIVSSWPISLLVLLLVIFILTLSRGAYLGLLASFLVFALFYARRLFTVRNFINAIVLIVGAIVFVGVIFSQLGQESKEKLLSHVTIQDFGASESTEGRLMAWRQAVEAWQENPWTGIGIGNYGLYTAGLDQDKPEVDNIVNNQYLELLAEVGISGSASFLILLATIIIGFLSAMRQAHESTKPWLVGLFAALAGTLVQYNFFSTLAIIHIWVLLGLLVAVEQLVLENAKIKMENSK